MKLEQLPGYLRDQFPSLANKTPDEYPLAYLDSLGILVWDGDFFATTLVEKLELMDQGGLVRIGIAPYNTKGELTRLLDALADTDSLKKFSVRAAKAGD